MMLAYAQLLRLPNVFTVFADIALAAFAAGYLTNDPLTFILLLASSGCLYCSGMVFNDIFDRKHDAKTRPQRPIPSGRISTERATTIGSALMFIGIDLAGFACGWKFELRPDSPLFIAIMLATVILFYDEWLKHTFLGPLAMGFCRYLNVYLGLSGHADGLAPEAAFHLAATIGLYITGVTWFARTEEGRSDRRHLLGASLVILAGLVLGLLLPVRLVESPPVYFVYLLVAFGLWIALKIVPAIQSPSPANVQAAVKRCILGLILLDAVLATLFVGWPGLLIALLLLPARWLGQWVYST